MTKQVPINIKKSLVNKHIALYHNFFGKRMRLFVRKSLVGSLILIYLVAFGGVIFQLTLYHNLPVADGEPYGVGDIINLAFALVVGGLWLTSSILSLTHCLLSFQTNKWVALKLFLLSTFAFLGYLQVG